MTNDQPSEPTEPPDTRSASEENLTKSRKIGPYKLLQKIGEGGMGDVWMAEQEQPIRRRVALKLIKAGMGNKQIISRFESERQALAMMDHQNIAKVLDAGTTEDGSPYFVMELVQGIPFNKYCDQNRLSIDERLALFIPVCQAVQHAHQKGIIHRDLKPSNVLVCMYDGQPVPKVIDFGLAKALQHQNRLTDKTVFTEFGQVVGTIQYMSPEQAEMNQLDIDTRTDIYSLGVMVYELLTGSTPIEVETLKNNALLQVLATIREQDPPRPSTRLSSTGAEAANGISGQRRIDPAKLKNLLRGELDWIVMKALEKDRTRRYGTATAFADDISNYLSGNVVNARPPTTGYRVRKYIGKHRGLVASLGSIAALLVIGVIATSWFAVSENTQRRDADLARKLADEKTQEVLAEKERADKEALRAREQQQQTEATLARSNYFLAVARWDANRRREANQLLDLVPEKYRNIEWYLAHRQFQGGYATLYGHADHVRCVAFSPDGSRITSASGDPRSQNNTIKLWAAASGQELRTLDGHTSVVTSVAFSPDGTRIASGSDDTTIKLWDADNGQELRVFSGHKAGVQSVAFSPDGTRIASGSDDTTIKLWDADNGQELRVLSGHKGGVQSVAFSPDGTRIALASDDETRIVWDVATGQPINGADWPEWKKGQNRSSDGRWLVVPLANGVGLVDLGFKNSPREKALRQMKARPDPWWHRQQANSAVGQTDWFAATFHRAWVIKSLAATGRSDDERFSGASDALQNAYSQWRKSIKDSPAKDLADPDILLQPAVREILRTTLSTDDSHE